MIDVTLTIYSAGGCCELTLEGDRLIVGRAQGEGARGPATLLVEDDGLAARHASINRAGGRVWVLDEGSTGGTFVNERRVPPQGSPLADNDEIFAGDHTTIIVHLRPRPVSHEHMGGEHALHAHDKSPTRSTSPPLNLAVAAPVLCLVGLAVVAVALLGSRSANGGSERRATYTAAQSGAPPEAASQTPAEGSTDGVGPEVAGLTPPAPADGNANPGGPSANHAQEANAAGAPQSPHGAKLYLKMSNEERLRFLEERARHVSMMMGNRPYAFPDEVLQYIKRYVDVYAQRVGNNSRRMWGEDLQIVFERARTRYAPHIIRAFNARGVPPVVGLYIAMIETEYHNIKSENFAGAAGLFQFIGPTARGYGVDPSERTNIEKMAPAAAHYMSDRIAEFGPDSMSVALAIAGYNRNPDSVRRDLRDVLDSNNKERSFWTLIANSNKLDHWFQNENVKYVPKFFAAAIVGENPEAFGLEMRKLSTYTTPTAAATP